MISVNGKPYGPAASRTRCRCRWAATSSIRQRFTQFTGKFVYHCHILAHEDAGMMGLIEVSRPGDGGGGGSGGGGSGSRGSGNSGGGHGAH